MKLKNSNWDETQIVIKLKTQIVMKLNNLNCDETKKNSICDDTQKLNW